MDILQSINSFFGLVKTDPKLFCAILAVIISVTALLVNGICGGLRLMFQIKGVPRKQVTWSFVSDSSQTSCLTRIKVRNAGWWPISVSHFTKIAGNNNEPGLLFLLEGSDIQFLAQPQVVDLVPPGRRDISASAVSLADGAGIWLPPFPLNSNDSFEIVVTTNSYPNVSLQGHLSDNFTLVPEPWPAPKLSIKRVIFSEASFSLVTAVAATLCLFFAEDKLPRNWSDPEVIYNFIPHLSPAPQVDQTLRLLMIEATARNAMLTGRYADAVNCYERLIPQQRNFTAVRSAEILEGYSEALERTKHHEEALKAKAEAHTIRQRLPLP